MASPCQLLSKGDRVTALAQLEAVAAEAWRIEEKFSRYRRGNIVDRINTGGGRPIGVDEETADLLDFAAALYRLSDGRFDVTSGILRQAWVFDGSDRLPDRQTVRRVLRKVGWHKVRWIRPVLQLAPDMEIDFGGLGKEYAVDRAAARAAATGDAPCLINFGGDLAAVGDSGRHEPWFVGVESPDAASDIPVRRIELRRGALATSGDARRFLLRGGVRYGHILDPRTGWPVAGAPRSVTVAADTCTQAGMLATFAMLEGPDAESFLRRQGVQFWAFRVASERTKQADSWK